MRKLALLALLLVCAIQCHAQVTLTTGPNIVVTLSTACSPVAAPTFSPVAGNYGAIQTVTISGTGSIFYTIDGSTPTAQSTQYTGPITVASSQTINAIAISGACSASLVGTAQYILSIPPTATPTFTPSPGTFATAPSVSVRDLSAGAIIYCTQDGSTPTTASAVYTTPFSFFTPGTAGTVTLKCIAKAPSFTQSGVQVGVYVYQPPANTPVISPVAGTYTTSTSVTITDACASSIIYYTVDNTTPTTGSSVYSGAINVTTSQVITAMATCPLYAQSAVVSQNYTIVAPQQAPTPTFSPNSTTSASPITFTINGLAGATAYYTTNNSTPTLTNGTSCAIPCTGTASSTETVKAIETAAGYSTSAVGSASYTISGGSTLPCPQTSSGLTVNVTQSRASGASPLLVFFDATGTTSSNIAANTTTFQDVTYIWNFNDSGVSGSGTWAYGSNPGKNSTNAATGGVAAHLYIASPGGGDQTYTATVTATDGTATVVCSAPVVTAYDPQDPSPNGFGGVNTTCVSAVATPVAGTGGCPAGAIVLKTATIGTALNGTYMRNGTQVLFHCGETFTGGAGVNAQRARIGAYGGCENTQTNRPILTGSSLILGTGSNAVFDIALSDLDLEGTGVLNNGTAIYAGSSVMPYQITVYNTLSNAQAKSFYDFNASQVGLVNFVMQGMGNFQGVFLNNSENQCVSGSPSKTAFNCGNGGTSYNPAYYVNIGYNAIIGSLMNGVGVTNQANGIETTRVSACRMCVFTNSTYENANAVGAVLKFHNGNPGSQANWIGQYTELTEVSDNLFTGKSGAQLVEITPQNSVTDERMRTIVFERNLLLQTSGNSGKLLSSCQNCSFRDNVFNSTGGSGSVFGLQMARRGIEWNGAGGSPTNASEPQYDEVYNNTFYGSIGAGFSTSGGQSFPAGNGWAINNLCYFPGSGACVTDSGASNTVSNNTATTTANPAFLDGSGAFYIIPDFVPTANYSGATSVPVFFDAIGTAWSGSYNLGALNISGPSPTVNFFTQPTVTSAAGNVYVAGKNGFNYGAVWMLDSVEPATCAGGSDPSGLFTTTFNPSALTGLSSTTGNLSYSSGTSPCTSPQSAASTVQATATSMGTYINSQDVGPVGGISKMGMFPEIWWAKPSTSPTGLTYPFVNYNGIQINFWAQVPTATWPGMPALGNTSSTGASYAAFDLGLEDLNGNQIVFDAGFFFGGEPAQSACKSPVQDNQGGTAWELKCQIASGADGNPYTTANVGYMTWLAGTFSSTVFSGYVQYTYNITRANFQQALNDIKSKGANVPANFLTDPNTWGFLHGHFNDECYFISAPCSLGTSEHDLTINLF